MAKSTDKSLEELKNSKQFKSIGVKDIIQNGSSVSLLIDPTKLNPKVRKAIATGTAIQGDQMQRAEASTMSNNPFDATYFEFMPLNVSIHDKIRLSMMYFKVDPLVGKIIELMTTFSNDGFKNEHNNPKILKFYNEWGSAISLNKVITWLFLEYYRSGNVTTWRTLVPYKNQTVIDNITDPPYSGESSKATGAKKLHWTKKSIPAGYTVLNPLTVYVDRLDGYSDFLSFHPPMLDNQPVDGLAVDDPTNLILKNLPREFEEKMKERNANGALSLPQTNVRRILRMRQPYEPYGQILMERAFAAIHEKNKLRQMDLTMVNSVINQIIKVTIGNDEFPATKAQIEKLALAFRNVGKSQTIFWNHTLNIEVIRPDTKVLDYEKYNRVNEDIRNAFGITEILTGGGGSKTNFATAYLSMKAFIANLMEGRKDILEWIRGEYQDIAEAMGFDSYPEPSFNPLSLTDEIAEKQIIMGLIDRQAISYETAVDRLGYDFRTELERKTLERPLIEEGILGIVGGPFQQPAGGQQAESPQDKESKEDSNPTEKSVKTKIQTEDGKAITIEKQSFNQNSENKPKSPTTTQKTTKGPSIGDAGRPSTPKGNYPTQRKTAKVKGQGSSELEVQMEMFDQKKERDYSTILATVAETNKNLKNPKSEAA